MVFKKENKIVIGKSPTVASTPTAPSLDANSALPGLDEVINKGLTNVGGQPLNINSDISATSWVASLSKKDMNKIIPWLKKFGASKSNIADYESAKNLLQINYATYITNSGFSVENLIKMFSDNATNIASTTAKVVGPTPDQRTITKLDPGMLTNLIDSVYISTIGKVATPEQVEQHITEFNKMNTGTLTTYKKVKDAKGKETNIASSGTPGFSTDMAKQKLEEQLKKDNPFEYQRRKAFEFSDALNQVVSGGI